MTQMTKPQQQPGSALFEAKSPRTEGKSLQAFLASLTVGGLIFIIEILLFILLRQRLPEI